MQRIITIQTAKANIKNFLSSTSFSALDPVALASTGQLILADSTNYPKVVGLSQKDVVAGTVKSTPVYFSGTVTNSGWNFTTIGDDVYLGSNGLLTQNTTGFALDQYFTKVGIAVSQTQLDIKIESPILNTVKIQSELAVASRVMYAALDKKVDIGTENLDNRMVTYSGKSIKSLAGVLIPDEDGTVLTNNSLLECVDYG